MAHLTLTTDAELSAHIARLGLCFKWRERAEAEAAAHKALAAKARVWAARARIAAEKAAADAMMADSRRAPEPFLSETEAPAEPFLLTRLISRAVAVAPVSTVRRVTRRRVGYMSQAVSVAMAIFA